MCTCISDKLHGKKSYSLKVDHARLGFCRIGPIDTSPIFYRETGVARASYEKSDNFPFDHENHRRKHRPEIESIKNVYFLVILFLHAVIVNTDLIEAVANIPIFPHRECSFQRAFCIVSECFFDE